MSDLLATNVIPCGRRQFEQQWRKMLVISADEASSTSLPCARRVKNVTTDSAVMLCTKAVAFIAGLSAQAFPPSYARDSHKPPRIGWRRPDCHATAAMHGNPTPPITSQPAPSCRLL